MPLCTLQARPHILLWRGALVCPVGVPRVFPAEACEELGGEFCEVEGVGQEVKPPPAPKSENPVASFFNSFTSKPEVGTVDYDGPKT